MADEKKPEEKNGSWKVWGLIGLGVILLPLLPALGGFFKSFLSSLTAYESHVRPDNNRLGLLVIAFVILAYALISNVFGSSESKEKPK